MGYGAASAKDALSWPEPDNARMASTMSRPRRNDASYGSVVPAQIGAAAGDSPSKFETQVDNGLVPVAYSQSSYRSTARDSFAYYVPIDPPMEPEELVREVSIPIPDKVVERPPREYQPPGDYVDDGCQTLQSSMYRPASPPKPTFAKPKKRPSSVKPPFHPYGNKNTKPVNSADFMASHNVNPVLHPMTGKERYILEEAGHPTYQTALIKMLHDLPNEFSGKGLAAKAENEMLAASGIRRRTDVDLNASRYRDADVEVMAELAATDGDDGDEPRPARREVATQRDAVMIEDAILKMVSESSSVPGGKTPKNFLDLSILFNKNSRYARLHEVTKVAQPQRPVETYAYKRSMGQSISASKHRPPSSGPRAFNDDGRRGWDKSMLLNNRQYERSIWSTDSKYADLSMLAKLEAHEKHLARAAERKQNSLASTLKASSAASAAKKKKKNLRMVATGMQTAPQRGHGDIPVLADTGVQAAIPVPARSRSSAPVAASRSVTYADHQHQHGHQYRSSDARGDNSYMRHDNQQDDDVGDDRPLRASMLRTGPATLQRGRGVESATIATGRNSAASAHRGHTTAAPYRQTVDPPGVPGRQLHREVMSETASNVPAHLHQQPTLSSSSSQPSATGIQQATRAHPKPKEGLLARLQKAHADSTGATASGSSESIRSPAFDAPQRLASSTGGESNYAASSAAADGWGHPSHPHGRQLQPNSQRKAPPRGVTEASIIASRVPSPPRSRARDFDGSDGGGGSGGAGYPERTLRSEDGGAHRHNGDDADISNSSMRSSGGEHISQSRSPYGSTRRGADSHFQQQFSEAAATAAEAGGAAGRVVMVGGKPMPMVEVEPADGPSRVQRKLLQQQQQMQQAKAEALALLNSSSTSIAQVWAMHKKGQGRLQHQQQQEGRPFVMPAAGLPSDDPNFVKVRELSLERRSGSMAPGSSPSAQQPAESGDGEDGDYD